MTTIAPFGGGPYHIARAYESAGARAPVVRAAPAPIEADAAASRTTRSPGLARLIAGIVPGRINFAAELPAQNTSAIAMYRHPADRLAAATAVHAGRLVDTTA